MVISTVESVRVLVDDRKTLEGRRQSFQRRVHTTRVCLRRDEDLHARTEIVIGGDHVIEAQHLRTITQQSGRVGYATQQRGENLTIEVARQQNIRHVIILCVGSVLVQ